MVRKNKNYKKFTPCPCKCYLALILVIFFTGCSNRESFLRLKDLSQPDFEIKNRSNTKTKAPVKEMQQIFLEMQSDDIK